MRQHEARDVAVIERMWPSYFRTDYIPGSDGEHCSLLFAAWFRQTGSSLLTKVKWESDSVVVFNFDDLNSKVPHSWEFADCIR